MTIEINKHLIYKKIVIPDENRHVIFSDIHGKKKEVDQLIKELGLKKNDHITFIGDLIDRGDHNSAMLFDVLSLDGTERPNINSVIGNHEHYMLMANQNEDIFLDWTTPNNGGDKTADQLSYVGMSFFSKYIYEQMPLILEVEHRGKKFGFVHAEIPFYYKGNMLNNWEEIVELAKNDPMYAYNLLWGRETFFMAYCLNNKLKSRNFEDNFYNRYNEKVWRGFEIDYFFDKKKFIDIPHVQGVDYILHGHTGVLEPMQYKNMIWFDTGFVKNRICAMEFDFHENKFLPSYLDEESYYTINRNTDLDFT